jgi:peptidoglycan hydrolase-like protein with peptidoglycan-binding domain
MRTALSRTAPRTVLLGLCALALVTAGRPGPSPVTATGDPVAMRTVASSSTAALPPTPGNFTGYGFDQCLAPTQKTMDAWLAKSPYLAVGIYVSGDSRACRKQPNLTPTWIRTQLRNGWKLLPITLGPQASCQPSFPRYDDDYTINPAPGSGSYPKARAMGRSWGARSAKDATALGIPARSTLWYDLEAFDNSNTHCRRSALAFLSEWVRTVKEAGFATGVYSSAASGIKALDQVRASRSASSTFHLPDHIWMARWDGKANTSSSYVDESGWNPGRRVKQYQGGHDETYGGVRINIDTDYLDLGKGLVAKPETRCGGVGIDFSDYGNLKAATADYTPSRGRVSALQCILKARGYYKASINGSYNRTLIAGVRRWKTDRGHAASDSWTRGDWVALLSTGATPTLKNGSGDTWSPYVRRVQRAINAARVGSKSNMDGTFGAETTRLVKLYQRQVKLPQTGVVDARTWARLQTGQV